MYNSNSKEHLIEKSQSDKLFQINEKVLEQNIKNNIDSKKIIKKDSFQQDVNIKLETFDPNKNIIYNGISYLPYNNKRKYENRKTYSFICESFKKDYNQRKGIKKMCYAKLVYNIENKLFVFNGPHTKECIETHTNSLKNDEIFNFNTNKFIEFEKLLYEKLIYNPFMKFEEFNKIAKDIYINNNYKFTIFKYTYKNLFNKIKKLLNHNNELIIEK